MITHEEESMAEQSETGFGTARTIDEVIDRLQTIVDDAKRTNSCMGYFAGLYRQVTVEVRHKIAEGYFDDNARMHRLDVVFANRYLDAYDAHQAGRPLTGAWKFAFEAADRWPYIVLQHLFLGMNAHINLDLGIAAAQTAPGDTIGSLENDFNKINTILVNMIDDVESRLARIWPMLRLLDGLALRSDEKLAAFSMEKAREAAWGNALILAQCDDASRKRHIEALDRKVLDFARLVSNPGVLTSSVFLLVRFGELGSVRRKIKALA
jgi:hypothetical protein